MEGFVEQVHNLHGRHMPKLQMFHRSLLEGDTHAISLGAHRNPFFMIQVKFRISFGSRAHHRSKSCIYQGTCIPSYSSGFTL